MSTVSAKPIACSVPLLKTNNGPMVLGGILSCCGGFLWHIGVVLLGYYWLIFGTTVGDTHNIGLLTDRISGLIVGSNFMVGASLLLLTGILLIVNNTKGKP